MIDWIIEGLRVMLWGLTSGLLRLMDLSYSLIKTVVSIDFVNTTELWEWWGGMMLFLTFFITVRLFMYSFKIYFDDEFRSKQNLMDPLVRITIIMVVFTLAPFAMKTMGAMGVYYSSNVEVLVGNGSDLAPSTILVTAYANTTNGYTDDNGDWVSNETITYKLDDVDINAKDPTGVAKYKFFSELSDLFVMGILGAGAAIMLIITALQVGKRSYEMVMLVLVSPVPISSLIVSDSDTFMTWVKMLVSNYLTTFFQVLSLMVVIVLTGNTIITSEGFWVQIIMLLAGLLFVLSGVPQVSRLIGGDTSAGSTLQQLASLRMATSGMGGSLMRSAKSLGGLATKGVGGTAVGGVYGLGRLMGGQSIGDYNAGQSSAPAASGGDGAGEGGGIDGIGSETPALSYAGSMAARTYDAAQTLGGPTGVAARVAVNAGSHIYRKSMRALQNSGVYKVKSLAHRHTSPQRPERPQRNQNNPAVGQEEN